MIALCFSLLRLRPSNLEKNLFLELSSLRIVWENTDDIMFFYFLMIKLSKHLEVSKHLESTWNPLVINL